MSDNSEFLATYTCIPDKNGVAIKLTHGSVVALHKAQPNGYVVRALMPWGEQQFIAFSNEGAAAIFFLLREEYMAGNLEDGMASLQARATRKDTIHE